MNDFFERNFGLSGKRALVTGAGRGIGRAIAEALSAAGAEVCVHYHSSQAGAEEVVQELEKAGGKAWSAGGDLRKSADANALLAEVKSHWGGLDILVNNTGDLVQRKPIAQFTDELLDDVVTLNFHSTVYMCRAAIPLLNAGVDPSIINLTSVAAHNGGGNGATVYAATKGAILTFTRGLAKELAPTIRVNGIAPGVAMTDFHRKHSSPEVLAAAIAGTPLKRLGTPEDHGAAAVFLAGRGASFITGETLEINGGLWVA